MRPRGENIDYDKLRARYDALAAELAEEKIETENACDLIARQGDLLRGVVNALRGEPPPDTLWSHHDVIILAAQMAQRVRDLEALVHEMHKSNHVLAAAAVPPSARTDFSVACACGHAPEEHGHVPGYPGSTACTVEGCDCIAYERGE